RLPLRTDRIVVPCQLEPLSFIGCPFQSHSPDGCPGFGSCGVVRFYIKLAGQTGQPPLFLVHSAPKRRDERS
ncbi:MAG: hypothetical protein P8N43_14135, partial [Alphaproteobacteria bacterium]|nr:hypothetical protein [Alphaproteobacteria bacterium]